MIEFDKISKTEHLPNRLFDRLLGIPKSDAAFLLPMLDGERRSGRTTKLSVFYADMLIKRGYVKVLDHFFSGSDRVIHEHDVRLAKMVIDEMKSRGYHFGMPRTEDAVPMFFHKTSNDFGVWCFAMVTDNDLDEQVRRCRDSIDHCTAFNNWMERKYLLK